MNIKSKTKYTNPKKLAQQQKLPIIKKLKKLSSINLFYLEQTTWPFKKI